MKKLIKTIPLFIFVLMLFCACGNERYIKISSGELYSSDKGVTAKFQITNHEKEKIDNLSLVIEAFDKDGNTLGKATAKYSIPVDPEAVATLSVSVNSKCEKAIAVSYEYSVGNQTKTGKFDTEIEATHPIITEADLNYETRQELAEALIKDIKRQFMLQKFETHGYYDNENNAVVIAAYTSKNYNDCIYENSIDSSGYKALAQSIATMSQTCYDEFQNRNFNDVQVSVGLLSNDEKILISATNGMVVENIN